MATSLHFLHRLWEDTHRKPLPECFLLALWEGGAKRSHTAHHGPGPCPHPPTVPSGAPESAHALDVIATTFHAVQSRNACSCHGLSLDVIFPEERCVAAHEPHGQTQGLCSSHGDFGACRTAAGISSYGS